MLPAFGRRREIAENDVQDFVFSKLSAGLGAKTVKDILVVLRMIAVYGARQGWFDMPVWNVRMPHDDARQSLPVLSVSEQRTVMMSLKKNFSFRNLGIYICLCTGMRIGEICGLKWDDICVKEKTIRVSRTIERIYLSEKGTKHTKVVVGTPKTACSCREIPVCGELLKMLRPLKDIANGDSFVLTNSGKPLEPRMYRHYYYRFMDAQGMPRLKFHGLRHTFATRCIESQCDYKTVSSILGHASISTTLNLYVHPDIGQKRKCIDKMLRTVGM